MHPLAPGRSMRYHSQDRNRGGSQELRAAHSRKFEKPLAAKAAADMLCRRM